jgi:hypothetical protein
VCRVLPRLYADAVDDMECFIEKVQAGLCATNIDANPSIFKPFDGFNSSVPCLRHFYF